MCAAFEEIKAGQINTETFSAHSGLAKLLLKNYQTQRKQAA
ncbi:hypothetical protein ALT785_770201 [Alteromonas infernus]